MAARDRTARFRRRSAWSLCRYSGVICGKMTPWGVPPVGRLTRATQTTAACTSRLPASVPPPREAAQPHKAGAEEEQRGGFGDCGRR